MNQCENCGKSEIPTDDDYLCGDYLCPDYLCHDCKGLNISIMLYLIKPQIYSVEYFAEIETEQLNDELDLVQKKLRKLRDGKVDVVFKTWSVDQDEKVLDRLEHLENVILKAKEKQIELSKYNDSYTPVTTNGMNKRICITRNCKYELAEHEVFFCTEHSFTDNLVVESMLKRKMCAAKESSRFLEGSVVSMHNMLARKPNHKDKDKIYELLTLFTAEIKSRVEKEYLK